MKINQDKIYSL